MANCVTRILESSTPSQWNHVSTEENPADDCSCGLTASDLCNSERLLAGPDFLLERDESWPVSPVLRDTQPVGAEVKKDAQVYVTEGEEKSPVDL